MTNLEKGQHIVPPRTYSPPLVSFVILDYNRPKEAELLLATLKRNVACSHEIVYVSNGGEQGYVQNMYSEGKIDVLVLSKANGGTGLGTKLGFRAASAKWVIYVQVDQFLNVSINDALVNQFIGELTKHHKIFYIDLAGNQGQGNYSERAGFYNRDRYLAVQELEAGYGGPGPYAHIQWSENAIQQHIKKLGFSIGFAGRLFGDNGKDSIREYPCGGVLKLTTDEKRLSVLKPVKARVDFPNLHLLDTEWETLLAGKWVDGTIPELHKPHSFKCWARPYEIQDLL